MTLCFQMPQNKFWGNEYKKLCFISMLRNEFLKAEMITKQATEDADVLIIKMAFLSPLNVILLLSLEKMLIF